MNSIDETIDKLKGKKFDKSELEKIGIEYFHPISGFHLFRQKNLNNDKGKKRFYIFDKEIYNGKEVYSFLFSR